MSNSIESTAVAVIPLPETVAAALERMDQAEEGTPELMFAMAAFADALTDFTPAADDARLDAAVGQCLEARVSDAAPLARVAAELLKLRHADRDPERLAEAGAALVADPLGGRLLWHGVNVDGQVEVAVTRYRRHLLLEFCLRAGLGAGPLGRFARLLGFARSGIDPAAILDAPRLAAAAAIAQQGFNNDYVFAVDADEREALADLEVRLAGLIRQRSRWFAGLQSALLIHAMYQSPARRADAAFLAEIPEPTWAEPARRLLQETLREPREEMALTGSIERVGKIADATSQAVRAHYEQHPYPHWRAVLPAVPTTLREFATSEFPELSPPADFPRAARVLVAGCGTGSAAVATALGLPDAEVIGTDISLPSLAYAARRARTLHVANLRLFQNDILEVAALETTFHFIQCAGVLHHMRRPAAGLAALVGVLEPGGLMRLALYGQVARRLISRVRTRIHELGLEATPEQMRSYRQRILFGEEPEEMWGVMRYRDFYTLSEFRDLLFHVQEHVLTLPAIGELVANAGLQFLSLDVPAPEIAQNYRQRFPEDPGMTNLANWDAFERDHPETFRQMFQFWCRRPAS